MFHRRVFVELVRVRLHADTEYVNTRVHIFTCRQRVEMMSPFTRASCQTFTGVSVSEGEDGLFALLMINSNIKEEFLPFHLCPECV